MLRPFAVCLIAILLTGCNDLTPAYPAFPLQQPPLPATASPSPSPGTAATPVPLASRKPSPAPTKATKACPTPPPDECCAVIYGALHGTVTDAAGQPVTTAKLVLKSDGEILMGGCTDALTSQSAAGAFAFNAVPFDVPLTLTVTATGFAPYSAAVLVPKGPVHVISVRLTRN